MPGSLRVSAAYCLQMTVPLSLLFGVMSTNVTMCTGPGGCVGTGAAAGAAGAACASASAIKIVPGDGTLGGHACGGCAAYASVMLRAMVRCCCACVR